MKVRYADPWERLKLYSRLRRGHFEARSTKPDYLADRRRSGRLLNRAAVESRIGWCPKPYRDAYTKLRRKLNSAADARALIEKQISADLKRHGPSVVETRRRRRRACEVA